MGKDDYLAEGIIFLPDNARFSYLLELTEGENIGKAINEAMKAIEDENPDLQGALPRNYTRLDNWVLMELLKLIGPVNLEGDAFGKVYEYFLGNFALREGQKGGVFYTSTSGAVFRGVYPCDGYPRVCARRSRSRARYHSGQY